MSSQSSSPVSGTMPRTPAQTRSTQSQMSTSGSPKRPRQKWVFDPSLLSQQGLEPAPSVQDSQPDSGVSARFQSVLTRRPSFEDLPPLIHSPDINDHLNAHEPKRLSDIRESSSEYPRRHGQFKFIPDDREESDETDRRDQQSKASSPSHEPVDYFTLQNRTSWDWKDVFDNEPVTGTSTYGHPLTPQTSNPQSATSPPSPTRSFKDLKGRVVRKASRALRGDK